MPERAREGWEPAFRAVFEASRTAIAVLDQHRVFLDANDGVTALLGYEREELVGRSIVEIIPRDDRDRASRDAEALRRDGTNSGDRRLLRADGSTVEVQFAGRLTELPGLGFVAIYVVIDSRAIPDGEAVAPEDAPPLTPRENEIVRMVALGQTNDEIAGQLSLSPETVRSHVRNAMSKTESRNRAQLVATALGRRLIVI
jgi:PAS domain S-box-containing protein